MAREPSSSDKPSERTAFVSTPAAPAAPAAKSPEADPEAAKAAQEKASDDAKPEPIPVEQRVQTGMEVREGEDVFQHGTEPEPAQQQEQALETKPVKAEHFLEDTPPPGQQKAPL